jgi:N-acetylglucosamine-6-sulfatase
MTPAPSLPRIVRSPGSARSSALVVVALVVLAGLLGGSVTGPTQAARPPSGEERGANAPDGGGQPNIVVVMADDMRVDDLRFAPSIRRLVARRGVRFENSFSSYPLCCPARASFYTGAYPHNHGVMWHLRPFGYGAFDDSSTLATSLSDAGYRTGFVGKYLNGYGSMRARTTGRPSWKHVPAGWTDWVASLDNPGGGRFHGDTYNYFDTAYNRNGRIDNRYRGRYQTEVVGDFSVRLARKYARSARPFFLNVNFVAPHHGGPTEKDDLRWVRRRDARVEDYASPARPSWVRGRFDHVVTHGAGVPHSGPLERDVSDKPTYFSKLPEINRRERIALRDLTRQRAEAIYVMDRQVRRLVRTLEQSGVWERTIFVFTSDNGYFLGEHRKRTGKTRAHEPSLRVPLVVSGPGVPHGGLRYDPVTTVDLTATLVHLAGATPPVEADGESRVSTLHHGDQGWDSPILTESAIPGRTAGWSMGRTSVGVRTSRYSLILNGPWSHELYDLVLDPLQDRNVYGEPAYAETRRRLREIVDQIKDCRGASCRPRLPDELAATPSVLAERTRHYWATVKRAYR